MEYQHFSLKPLTQYDMDTLIAWHDEFMQTVIEPIYLPKAQALVDEHREKGDDLLIITATNSFVTRPIGQMYGITNLIGTDPEMVDGRFTGEVDGVPSFQNGKVVRLKTWLEDRQISLEGSYFYSDSHNDQPLLELVDNPVVVDADDTLLKVAQRKNWPAISLR
jgi:HAD superfamily hydrolase (TIGR01490 family)